MLLKGFIVTVALVSLSRVALSAVEYNYRLSDATYGPNGWAATYPDQCNGSRQSPIDIKVNDTKYDALLAKGVNFSTNINEIPSGPTMQIGNNKYSYRVYLKKDHFYVEGGGLPGRFNVFSFHFHWGSNNSQGSEHTIDGKKYPAALHFVNWNTKYHNITEALKYEDGLAALGVLLEVNDATENVALSSFLKYAENVTHPKELYNITQTHKLIDLMPAKPNEFYRYNGSLTTPICQEVVTWTVFKHPQTITTQQLTLLRSLKDSNESSGNDLTDTFRPVQALNGRTVLRSYEVKHDVKPVDPTNISSPTNPSSPAPGAFKVSCSLMVILSAIIAFLPMF